MKSNGRFAAALAWAALSGAVAAPAGAQEVADTADDAPPPQIELHLDRLAAGADTFELVHQGQPIGRIFTTLEREGEDFVFRERTETPMGHQETEVRFSAAGEMREVSQQGKAGPTDTRIELTYAEGRVRGAARVAQPGGEPPRELTIDAAVPPGVVDDNLLMVLFPALDLEPGRSFAIPVFAAGQDTLREYRFEVSPGPELEVAGGSFPTLRLDAEGAGMPLAFLVTESEPHALLKILPAGPVEVVRESAVP